MFSLFTPKANMRWQKRMKQDRSKGTFWAILLVVVATLIIVYFMPRTATFNYDYRIGQPWRYGALYAKEKFNILKSDSTLHTQGDSLRRQFQPYFNVNATVLPAMQERLRSMTVKTDDGTIVTLSRLSEATRLLERVIPLMDSVYSRGVIDSEVYDSLARGGTTHVRMVSRNVAIPRSFSDLFTPHTAYEYLIETAAEDDADRTQLQQFNLNLVVEENAVYDALKSMEECESMVEALSPGVGFVMQNERIVDRGEVVTTEIADKIRSYQAFLAQQDYENEQTPYIIAGQFVMVLTILILLATFLYHFHYEYLAPPRAAILAFLLITLWSLSASMMVHYRFYHIFMLPCCMLPMIVRIFLNSRTAFFCHIATVLIISLQLSYPYEFILLQAVAGMVAIQTLRQLSQRSQIFSAAAVITLTMLAFHTAYELALGVTLAQLSRTAYIYILINGIALLFTYPLLYLIERTFGFVSDVTLVELSNINNKLLRQMTEVASGTFNHSLQVANLCSDVANRIGANVQLVRTGALYHDIGKMARPAFFTENQGGVNPHRHLSPEKSAEVIIRHVTQGITLAKQYRLPAAIQRFILTHHGAGKVKFFYITYQNEHPGEPVDEALFTYPGPNPTTKEEAILMMCDTVEAASRSLKEYTEESISQLVDRLVDGQVQEGYFRECAITFADIAIAKNVLKERLKNIYHTRISYPELQQSKAGTQA